MNQRTRLGCDVLIFKLQVADAVKSVLFGLTEISKARQLYLRSTIHTYRNSKCFAVQT